MNSVIVVGLCGNTSCLSKLSTEDSTLHKCRSCGVYVCWHCNRLDHCPTCINHITAECDICHDDTNALNVMSECADKCGLLYCHGRGCFGYCLTCGNIKCAKCGSYCASELSHTVYISGIKLGTYRIKKECQNQ